MKPGDVAIIFTPDDSHFSLAAACINAGLHVLVAKPIVKTLAEHKELVDLARRQNVLVGGREGLCLLPAVLRLLLWIQFGLQGLQAQGRCWWVGSSYECRACKRRAGAGRAGTTIVCSLRPTTFEKLPSQYPLLSTQQPSGRCFLFLQLGVEYHKRFDPIYSDARNRARNLGPFSYFYSYMAQVRGGSDWTLSPYECTVGPTLAHTHAHPANAPLKDADNTCAAFLAEPLCILFLYTLSVATTAQAAAGHVQGLGRQELRHQLLPQQPPHRRPQLDGVTHVTPHKGHGTGSNR